MRDQLEAAAVKHQKVKSKYQHTAEEAEKFWQKVQAAKAEKLLVAHQRTHMKVSTAMLWATMLWATVLWATVLWATVLWATVICAICPGSSINSDSGNVWWCWPAFGGPWGL